MKNYFLDMPIYRCSKLQYKEELNELKSKIRKETERSKRDFKNDSLYEKELVDVLFYHESYIYDYNEVIGWLKFYIEGSQIRGDLYYECSKHSREIKTRFRRGIRTKQFAYREDFFIFYVGREDDSDLIFKKFVLQLKKVNKLKFKRRYFDLEIIENIGRFLDFRKLIENLNPYNNM